MLARVQPSLTSSPRLAVILNRRARGCSTAVVDRLARLVPAQDLYLSGSLDESRRIAEAVVARGYPSVMLGGGDGTVTQCLTDLRAEARKQGLPLPSVGVLKLGTGNALAYALGASGTSEAQLARDLGRAANATGQGRLHLLEVEGRLTPFAGLGLDAQIQDDFNVITRSLDGARVGRHLGAGLRYALAVAGRSLPRYLTDELPEVTVINRGAPARRVDVAGRTIGEPVPHGAVLWRGRASIVTASTIPFFGLGMRMFPHAERQPGRFQIRCARMGAAQILRELPSIWRGSCASEKIFDFLVDQVELRVERKVPVQVGGDVLGEPRDRLVVGISRPISVVA